MATAFDLTRGLINEFPFMPEELKELERAVKFRRVNPVRRVAN